MESSKPKRKSRKTKVVNDVDIVDTNAIEVSDEIDVDRVALLLKGLDEANNVTLNKDVAARIEIELSKMREKWKSKRKKEDHADYIPYPEYEDDMFHSKISSKKEFLGKPKDPSLSKMSYDQLVSTKCSSTSFKLTHNQIFLKNFISQHTPYNGILLFHGVGVGKCFAKGTPILMYDGSLKKVEDIELGDIVMGDDSSPRHVTSLASGVGKMYKVIPEYGNSYFVNEDHVLCLINKNHHPHQKITMSVKDYLTLSMDVKKGLFGYRSRLTFFPLVTPTSTLSTNTLSAIQLSTPQYRVDFVATYLDLFGKLCGDVFVCHRDCNVEFIMRSIGLCVNHVEDETHVFGDFMKFIPLIKLANEKKYIRGGDGSHRICVALIGVGNYFGFGVDGNHKFMLGDFTITHNSCSAISIAEQFMDVFRKKVLVLAPGTLSDNFKQQIFDRNRGTGSQCTGTIYSQYLTRFKNLTQEARDREMNKIIESKYEFMGFIQFANYVNRIAPPSGIGRTHAIKQEFSDRVIIIDEVHNVRDSKEVADEGENNNNKQKPLKDQSKIAPPIILEVLEKAENVKLILLTATPMYNIASEIVWLLNLLLANDKRKQLNEKVVFDKNGSLTPRGVKELGDVCRGYVSYMRGENPYSFPLRLYPSVNASNANHKQNHNKGKRNQQPGKDNKGQLILLDNRLKSKELVISTMSEYQMEKYNTINVGEERESKQRQMSNVVYPHGEGVGKTAFDGCFDRIGTVIPVKYKKGKDEFLSPKLVGTYAPKIKSIIDSIKRCEGIVYVYTFFIECGILPLAIALEHEGFVRYGDSPIIQLSSSSSVPKHHGKPPTYAILSANTYTADFEGTVKALKAESNANGQDIKVILGTTKSAEGWDFKCIREVHILEPWYHLNKIEQIVGRAVRNCSHVLLPVEKRNVTVYQHINVFGHQTNAHSSASSSSSRSSMSSSSDSPFESTDQRVYRIAENKQLDIDKVERIMKNSSVDCMLNKSDLFFKQDIVLDLIVTSQGTRLHNYALGDTVDGKHGNITCTSSSSPASKHNVDMTTFHKDFYKDEIDDATPIVAALFATDSYLSFEDIRDKISPTLIGNEVLMYTLDHMLSPNARVLVNGDNSLIYRANLYMLQPITISDTRIPLDERAGYELPIQYSYRLVPKEKDKDRDRIKEKEKDKDKDNQPSPARSTTTSNSHDENENVLSAYHELYEKNYKESIAPFAATNRQLFTPDLAMAFNDYIIDRLSKQAVFEIAIAVISSELESEAKQEYEADRERKGAKQMYDRTMDIRRSLVEGHILVASTSPTSPWFIRDAENGKLYDSKNIKKEISTYESNTVIVNDKIIKHTRQVRGYFGKKNNKTNSKSFNIFDPTNKTKSKQGFVCVKNSKFSKEDAIKNIEEYNKEIAKKATGILSAKNTLCCLYEILLRAATRPPLNEAIFMRPYEVFLAFSQEASL